MRKSNYDKMPATVVDGTLWKGWESIRKRLAEIHAETNGSQVWVVECYQGVHHEELMRELQALAPDRFINTRDLFKSAEDIEAMTYPAGSPCVMEKAGQSFMATPPPRSFPLRTN